MGAVSGWKPGAASLGHAFRRGLNFVYRAFWPAAAAGCFFEFIGKVHQLLLSIVF
jgi:hypothetical protein